MRRPCQRLLARFPDLGTQIRSLGLYGVAGQNGQVAQVFPNPIYKNGCPQFQLTPPTPPLPCPQALLTLPLHPAPLLMR